MVILFLRHFTNPVGEVQRLPKIVEPILLLEMMLVDDRPSPIQLREQRVELGALQGWNTAATWHTRFLRQIAHCVLSLSTRLTTAVV